MKKIMFVCTGNICRSAMAHGYMQKKVNDDYNNNKYLISSCGTYAINGDKSTNNAILAMKEYDVDLNNHRATNINDIDIENYDLILCMTTGHKRNVQELYPKLKDKVYTLKEYVNNNIEYKDIDDPWGLNLSVYRTCAKEIVDNVDKLIKKIEVGE